MVCIPNALYTKWIHTKCKFTQSTRLLISIIAGDFPVRNSKYMIMAVLTPTTVRAGSHFFEIVNVIEPLNVTTCVA